MENNGSVEEKMLSHCDVEITSRASATSIFSPISAIHTHSILTNTKEEYVESGDIAVERNSFQMVYGISKIPVLIIGRDGISKNCLVILIDLF